MWLSNMIILLGGFGSTNMYYLLQGDHIYIYTDTYMYNCNMQLSFIIRIPVI